MEAATTETAPELIVAEQTTFISKALDQTITVVSGTEALKNNRGETVQEAFPGFYPSFVAGRLDTEMLRKHASDVGLEGDEAERMVQKAIDVIRELDHFNVNATNGIWEEGAAPDEARPTVDEQNAQIGRAAAMRDRAALEALIADEQETHNRRVVIRAAESALAGIDAAEEAEGSEGGSG